MSEPKAPDTPTRQGGLFRRGGLAAGLIATLTACLPSLELPIPAPMGRFPVGVTQQTLAAPTPADTARVLTLDIWYPARDTTGYPRAPYTENALNDALSQQFRMPRFMFSEVPSYSHREAPAVPGPHAVVIFNHGYAAFSAQNVSTFQELASHGYLVVSLAHPGDSLLSRDAEGKAIPFDAESDTHRVVQRLQNDMTAYAQRLAPRLEGQRQAQTPQAYARASAELGQDPQFVALRPQIARWVEDTRTVVAALRGDRRPGILREADGENLTVMGHSLGGLVAMRLACEPVEGLRGIINLDAPWFQDDPEATIRPRVPSLNLLSTHYVLAKQDLASHGTLHGLYRESAVGAHVLEVKGSAHYNFTDLNFVPALKMTPMLGPVDNRRMAQLQNEAIREFLRRTTRGEGALYAPLLPTQSELEQHVFPGRPEGA
ncbi:Alpha/beta hydrolase family protein [compost metagenome]